jgi:tetratricopeptide (TPR) repeat protein
VGCHRPSTAHLRASGTPPRVPTAEAHLIRAVLPVLLLWVGLVLGSVPLRRFHERIEPPRPKVRFEDVLLDLLGEGRTMLARLLWFKMDMMHEQLDDQGIDTFQQTQLVPLLRMVTFLDPTITDAYDTLAFELYHGQEKIEDAIKLLDEGLIFNKQSYELNWRRGLLAEKQGDWNTALVYANNALGAAGDDYIKRMGALRSVYRIAVHAQDPIMGMRVVDSIRALNPDIKLYDQQYDRWKSGLTRPR